VFSLGIIGQRQEPFLTNPLFGEQCV
jgi:hypothetical protein